MSQQIASQESTVTPSLFGREPVMWLAIIQSGLALAAGFGFDLTTAQIGLVLAFSAAVLGFLARSQVTPVEALPEIPVDDVSGFTYISPASRHTRPSTGVRRETKPGAR